jgi:phage tail-like protein
MSSPAQKIVLLRDQQSWPRASLAGLEVDVDGALILAPIPGVAAAGPTDLPGPYDPTLDGFAVGACGEIVFAVRADQSLVLVDTSCADLRLTLSSGDCPGDATLTNVTGLAATGDRLYVADEGSARVLVFVLPRLELSAVWQGPFTAPRRVAVDGDGRVYVLDAGLKRVLRFDVAGRRDAAYDTGTIADLASALDLFVATDGTAFVSVDGAPAILRLSPSGASAAAGPLPPPDGAPGLRPGALAGDAQRMYVADRASGAVWVYDLGAGVWLAPLPQFRAPVVGMATDGAGHLYVRTDADETYVRLDARSASASVGRLDAGPFDAGERCAWMRVHLDADVPATTRVFVETALADRPDPPPPLAWQTAPTLDFLVHPPEPADVAPDPAARFLWLRVHVETDDPARSPRLRQVAAETPGDNYLARLPAMYARKDAEEGGGFLRALLESFRAELGDSARAISDLARLFDPATTPDGALAWLSSWVAFDLPVGSTAADQRQLLLDAHRLYGRRGTVRGLREMVRIYTGVDCEIVESFHSRRLWALDGPARLGFDTGLLPCLPDGMVVPGPSLPDPALQGLSVEYFLDDALAESATAPDSGGDGCAPRVVTPPAVEPDGGFPGFQVPAKPAFRPLTAFSARWTGQLRARSTDLWTILFRHEGGARVYLDDQPLIDSWTSPGKQELRGVVPLEADAWYPLRIEYWTDKVDGSAIAPRLSWSSRDQPQQVVPHDCLYALSDDNVDPNAQHHDGSAEPMIVGETMVGAGGPLAAEDFGAPLFTDSAHLFTVRVKAAAVQAAGRLDAVRAVLDAEKPAHTDYHLCVVEPTFRVGVQARVGIDAFVAPPPPPGRLDEGALGVDARLGISPDHDDGTLRVDETLRIGTDAILR